MEQQQKPLAFTPYQRLLIVILTFLQFTVILDFMVLSPLGDILIKSFDITPKQFGWVVSSYAFSAGASGIMAAGFADKFDRKKILIFFYTGFIAGTLCCAFANSYYMLLGARIITGLFGGVIGAVSLAIVADIFQVNQRGRVMGFLQMAFTASQVLGIPIGLYLATLWGWHSAFLLIVGIGILILFLVVTKMKPIIAHLQLQTGKSPFLHLWHTIAKRNYRIGFLATAFLSVGGFMLMPFGSAFLVNNVGISQKQLPMVFMFTGIASIVIMPLVGRLSDRMDKFFLFSLGSGLAIIMIVIYTHMGITPLWLVVVINMILFMGIMSRMIPAQALTTSIPDLGDRGAFMSINASLQQMAGGIAAICAGLIVSQQSKSAPLEHYDILGYVVAGVIITCLFLVYRVSVILKKKMQPPPQA